MLFEWAHKCSPPKFLTNEELEKSTNEKSPHFITQRSFRRFNNGNIFQLYKRGIKQEEAL